MRNPMDCSLYQIAVGIPPSYCGPPPAGGPREDSGTEAALSV